MRSKTEYEHSPLYYGTPCQVRFYDTADGLWRGGIALRDFIICGCCVTMFSIKDVVDEANKDGFNQDYAIVELDWLDINNKIIGK